MSGNWPSQKKLLKIPPVKGKNNVLYRLRLKDLFHVFYSIFSRTYTCIYTLMELGF